MTLAPQWILPEPEELPPDGACGPDCIRRLLWRKGFLTTEQSTDFLRPRLASLGDPFLLRDLRKAVERIFSAIDGTERIALYGDYDVDGVTSLALLDEMLRAYGARPALFLPSRIDEGYGLTRERVERCCQLHQPQLLIAVDCGTSSCSEVAELRARKIEVIVLDHHEPKSELPECVALVNPKLESNCALRYLCSAGVVFKLCHALLKTRPISEFNLQARLDLVALGTVADIVPLEGENRVLVHHGARELAKRRLFGIRQLMEVAAIKAPILSEHIGFRLGPRLNAAGRLSTAEKALQLLRTTDAGEAAALAAELDAQNRERQNLEREVFDAADARVNPAAAAIVVGERDWHPGVLGIVASRLVRKYHRPAIVIGFDLHGLGKGSGRSIAGFSLVQALARAGELLERFGGHEMAAGLTITQKNFFEFTRTFEQVCRESLSDDELRPRLHLDHELSLGEFNWELLRWHELLQPFGNGNPQPVFLARRVEPAAPPQIVKEKHLVLRLRQNGRYQRAIFFEGATTSLPDPPWDIAYRIGSDEYEGEMRLQMQVEALRQSQ